MHTRTSFIIVLPWCSSHPHVIAPVTDVHTVTHDTIYQLHTTYHIPHVTYWSHTHICYIIQTNTVKHIHTNTLYIRMYMIHMYMIRCFYCKSYQRGRLHHGPTPSSNSMLHICVYIHTYLFHHEGNRFQIQHLTTSCSPWRSHRWPRPQDKLWPGLGHYGDGPGPSVTPSLEL